MPVYRKEMSEIDFLSLETDFHGGTFVYEPSATLGPRIQRDLQLVYVYEGWMEIRVDGVARRLHAGQSTLLLPGGHEVFQFATDGRTRHGWVSASRPDWDSINPGPLASLSLVADLDSRMRDTARLLESLWLRADGETRRLERGALSCALILQHVCSAAHSAINEPPAPPPVDRTLNWICRHFAETVRLEDLAAAAGVGGAHLTRLFRKHRNQTPMQALWDHRLNEGERLLVQTGYSVSEIAYRCGFQTPYHFSRRIKQRSGLSPTRLRKRAWGT